MTDDIFYDLRPSRNHRPYRFYKVTFSVRNKFTERKASKVLYISCHYSPMWLDSIASGFYYFTGLRDHFSFTWVYEEVDDSPSIYFRHITTRENMEHTCVCTFLEICGDNLWRYDFKLKVRNFLSSVKSFIKKPDKYIRTRVFSY